MSLSFLGSRVSQVGGSDTSNEYTTSTAIGTGIMCVPVSPATVDNGLAASGFYAM